MKKILSILLSLSITLSNVNQNVCLADTSVDQVNAYQKVEQLETESFAKKFKKALKATKDFISENSLTIIAFTAAFAISAFPTINGVKNFSKIKELLADNTLTVEQKLINLTKILFNVKGIFADTPNTENVEQSNGTTTNTTTETQTLSGTYTVNGGNTPDVNSSLTDKVSKDLESKKTDGENDIENPPIVNFETVNETESTINATNGTQILSENLNEIDNNFPQIVIKQAKEGTYSDKDKLENQPLAKYHTQQNVINSIKKAGITLSYKAAYGIGGFCAASFAAILTYLFNLLTQNRNLANQNKNNNMIIKNLNIASKFFANKYTQNGEQFMAKVFLSLLGKNGKSIQEIANECSQSDPKIITDLQIALKS